MSYTVLFVVGDIVSLVVQAIGGGTASAAETLEDANRGGYVMVSPELQVLVFQRISKANPQFVPKLTARRSHLPTGHYARLHARARNLRLEVPDRSPVRETGRAVQVVAPGVED